MLKGVLLLVFGCMFMTVESGLILLVVGLTLMSSFQLMEFGVSGLVSMFYVKSLTCGLMNLSFWILILSGLILFNLQRVNNFEAAYIKSIICMSLTLFLSFTANSYLMFFIGFELSLLPILNLVLGWGAQPERVQAGVYMMFYTLFGSLPLLILVVAMNGEGLISISSLFYLSDSVGSMSIWWLMGSLAFFMKLPAYLVHIWLPKAHVESPLGGSMILAGVLLKLGGYGLMITSYQYLSFIPTVSPYVVILGLLGGSLVGLMCMTEVDMKSLVAYSSVVHMGLVLAGVLTMNQWGWDGSGVVMLGHGLCSSGLFYMVNTLYERSGSRSLLISSGAMSYIPLLTLSWFILSVGNMSAPLTLNLIGELGLFISLVSWSNLSGVTLFLISFFSGGYSLYLFSGSQHGSSLSETSTFSSGEVSEHLVLSLHWVPLNLLFLSSNLYNGMFY